MQVQKASLIAAIDAKWQKSSDEISTLYVVKNSEGIPISINEGRVRTWTGMWNQNHSELDLPVTPSTPGNYTVDIYFAGQYVTTQSFSIVPEMTEEPGTSAENTEE